MTQHNKDKMFKPFFERLNYSFGNEDWKTEQKALQIRPQDSVLCITASGDRPLHLLLDDCSKLTAIDSNPFQNHLLNLKCAALQSLDYEDYISFLGGVPSKHRSHFFHKVLPNLNDDSAHFWHSNLNMIRKGILYQGEIERLTKVTGTLFGMARPLKIKKLFQMESLDEQIKFIEKKWDTFFLRRVFDLVLSRFLISFVALDPGLYVHLDPSIRMGSYFYKRMMHSLNHCLAKDNLLISLLFRGYVDPRAFPPYLKEKDSSLIKERLSRLSIKTRDVIAYLEEVPPNSYDRLSLSDVASYMDQHSFNRLIKKAYRAAKPGARFCIRQFSSNHKIPIEFEDRFRREFDLEKKLEKEDRCFVYRFMVGEIIK
jgi:S-adenosylmethionine-diacylglycerol 3-amino-3-carboxypropyl transferase